MKNSTGNLIAGILIHDELKRQEEVIQHQKDIENKNTQDNLKQEIENSTKKNADLQKTIQSAKVANLSLGHQNQLLKQKIEYYEKLLAQPMQVIAEHNDDFKKTFEEQQTHLADWMVSQKAFKELAIQFGLEKELEPQDVIEMGLDKKIDVLEDKHEPSHNTNVGDATLIGNRRDKLIDKAKNIKLSRQSKKGS
jgi:hypothetical protein